jgi:class 3 adenylate cyclase
MFDLTLIKGLTEIIANNLTFTDIEDVGKYFFKDYNTHKLEKVDNSITISTLTAARRFVNECVEKNLLDELFKFLIELDGTALRGRKTNLIGLENLLYSISKTGMYFDYNKRKFVKFDQDKEILLNWGSLKDGKEYDIVIASIDICSNSELVKKYKPSIMEKEYYRLWDFLRKKSQAYNGRIWSWAGDGGLIAFRSADGVSNAVSCCLEVQFSLPVYNNADYKSITEDICLRIGMDMGNIKFFTDTGKIISDIINYAAHLEKKGTNANGVSVSENIFNKLNPKMKNLFKNKINFEGKNAYSMNFDFICSLK